jgi:hypothetical protein
MAGFEVEGGRPCIPDAEYELKYLDYSTALVFNAPKLVVRFAITAMGPYFGVALEKWYRVKKHRGRPKKYGDFVVGASSDFFRDLCRLLGAHAPRSTVLHETQPQARDREDEDRVGGFPTAKAPGRTRYSVIDELKLS